jgi:hypothetical protein
MTPDWRDRDRRLSDGKACLAAALEYLARGWSVLPLCPPDHIGTGSEHSRGCDSPGKVPLVYWKTYQGTRPTTQEVHHWWARWPTANVGVVMGPVSGLVGVDLDGPEAEAAFARAVGAASPGETLEFTTGRGRRLLYALPPGVLWSLRWERTKLPGEVRLLGLGAQTVAPPSRHPSGAVYTWVRY